MQLLTGADITIRFDPDKKVYIAHVFVGSTSTEAIAKDPVKALGLAVMLQGGFTEDTLKAELTKGKP
jgi:hypothetical protein